MAASRDTGVAALAVLDKTNEKKYSATVFLAAAAFPVRIDNEPATADDKIFLFNGEMRSDTNTFMILRREWNKVTLHALQAVTDCHYTSFP